MTRQEFEEEITNYGKDILSFCRTITCSKQEGDELFQDTIVKMMENLDKIAIDQNHKSYGLAIAIHIWKNKKSKFARRNRIAPSDSLEKLQDAEIPVEIEDRNAKNPEEMILQKEQKEEIQRMVAYLPKRQRIVITLFYSSNLSVKEIAELLHIPEGTVKSRLHNAKENLRKQMEVAGYDR